MAIPKLKKQDIIDALKFIDENGVPEHNTSVKYVLVSENGKKYPPKYVVAIADHLANGTDISTESLTALTQRTIWKVWASPSRLSSKKNLSYLLLPKASSQQMNALQWII